MWFHTSVGVHSNIHIILSLFLTNSDRATINVLRRFLVPPDEIVCLEYCCLCQLPTTRFFTIIIVLYSNTGFPQSSCNKIVKWLVTVCSFYDLFLFLSFYSSIFYSI